MPCLAFAARKINLNPTSTATNNSTTTTSNNYNIVELVERPLVVSPPPSHHIHTYIRSPIVYRSLSITILTMVEDLAGLHGSEVDKDDCPFYFKVGACRRGDQCNFLHLKPASSRTILMKHLYPHSSGSASASATTGSVATAAPNPESVTEEFLDFFEDVYMEVSKFGRLEDLFVLDNVVDHMNGNVYAQFSDENEAAHAMENLQGRYYAHVLIDCEHSPVTEFVEARCTEYDKKTCSRAKLCNFLHVKAVPADLLQSLNEHAEEERRVKQQEKVDKKHRQKARRKRSKFQREKEDRHKRSKRSRSSASSQEVERSRATQQQEKVDEKQRKARHTKSKFQREKEDRHKRSKRSRSSSASASSQEDEQSD
jgi:splicing factor U2AF subunit